MGKYRIPSEKSKYYIPKEDYLTVIHYSLRYPLWKQEVESMADTSKAIVYDKEKVQTYGNYDSTYEAAVRCAELSQKIDLIDKILEEVAPGLETYIRLSVCYGLTYYGLMERGMPINRNEYSILRQKFYFELSKKI